MGTQAGRAMLRGMFRYLSEHDTHWDLRLKREAEEFDAPAVHRLPQWSIDGIIYAQNTDSENSKQVMHELSLLTIPIAAIDVREGELVRSAPITFINAAPEDIVRHAVHTLVHQGNCRAYGFVPDVLGRKWSILRGEAFAAEMRRRGLPCLIYDSGTRGVDDFSRLCAFLRALPKPAGLFVAYDDRALTVLEACRQCELSVPNEVSVIGVDDDELIDTWSMPPLSSIRPDHEAQGYLAAEALERMMASRQRRSRQKFVGVSKVSIRGTTLVESPAAVLLQRALAVIDAEACFGLTPAMLATRLHVSRRLLDLRFSQSLHCSVNQTIRTKQLEEVCRRLRETTEPIETLGASCGFATPNHLKALFRATFNMTMSSYRRLKSKD